MSINFHYLEKTNIAKSTSLNDHLDFHGNLDLFDKLIHIDYIYSN